MRTLFAQLRKVVKKNSRVLIAYIIGSYAKKYLRDESDFDLVIVVDNRHLVNLDKIYHSIQPLPFPKNLDLSIVDHNSSPLFLFETIRSGVKIYEKDRKETANFEAAVLHKYYDNQHIRNIYYSYLKNKFA